MFATIVIVVDWYHADDLTGHTLGWEKNINKFGITDNLKKLVSETMVSWNTNLICLDLEERLLSFIENLEIKQFIFHGEICSYFVETRIILWSWNKPVFIPPVRGRSRAVLENRTRKIRAFLLMSLDKCVVLIFIAVKRMALTMWKNCSYFSCFE